MAGLWYYARGTRPWRYESRGNASTQRGLYGEALNNYKRAISMTRDTASQIRLLKRMIAAAEKMPAPSEAKAYEAVRDLLSYRGALAALEPGNAEYAREFLTPYFRLVKENGNAESWNQFRATIGKMAAGAPKNPVLLKYDGIANVVWMLQAAPEEKYRLKIGDAMMKVQEALPEDAQVAFYLACWCMNEARIRQDSADQLRRGRLLEKARLLMEEQVKAHPDDLEVKLDGVRVLLDMGNFGDLQAQGATTRARALLAELEQQLADGTRPDLAMEVANILRSGAGSGVAGSVTHAMTFLQLVLKKHPEQQEAQFELGVLCRLAGDQEGAVAALAKAAQVRPVAVDISVMKQQGLRFAARRELTSLYFDLCEKSAEGAEQAGRLATAEDSLAQFRTLSRNDATATGILEARLAIAKDQPWEALEKLAAVTAGTARNPEALFWQGFVLSRQGECGAALRCFRDVFSVEAAAVGLRVRTAKEMVPLLLRLKRFDDAAELAGNLAKNHPADPAVPLLQADIQMARDSSGFVTVPAKTVAALGEAVKLIKPQAEKNDPEARLRLAELYVRIGDSNRAWELIRTFAPDAPVKPEQFRRLVMLEQTLGLTESLVARLGRGLGASSGNRAAELAYSAVAARSGVYWERLGNLVAVALLSSPAEREVALAEFAKMAGAADEAKEAILRAQKLDPTNPRLLRFLVAEALGSGKLDAAAALLADGGAAARMENVERMQCKARLCLLRNEAAAAATILEGVTKRRPQSSEAWWLLGEARRVMGKTGEAVAALRKAVELKPDNAPALLELFRILDETGEYAKALDCLRQLLVFQPQDIHLANLYLDYLAQHDSTEEALALRRAWAAANPADLYNRRAVARFLLDMNKPDLAQKEIEAVAAKDPENRETVLLKALLERAWNRPEAGRELLDSHLRRRAEKADFEDWICMARYLRLIQAMPDAIQAAYAEARRRENPKTMPATLELAEWQASRGAISPALELYREVRQKTGSQAVCSAILDLLMSDNRHDEAEQELEIWRKATAPVWSSQQAMVSALLLARKNNIKEADAVISAAIANEPKNARLYLIRAQIFYDDRSTEKIIFRVKADLEQAVQLDPNLIHPQEMLQNWCQRESYTVEAGKRQFQLLELRMAMPSYRLQLAQQYARQNRDHDLEDLIRESMQKADAPVWHQMLASFYRKRGNVSDAVRELGKAYAMQPTPASECIAQYADALVAARKPQQALELIRRHPVNLKTSPALNIIYGRALEAERGNGEGEAVFAATIHAAADTYANLRSVLGQFLEIEKPAAVNARLERERQAGDTQALALASAQLLVMTGNPAGALALLERVAAEKPGNDLVLRATLLELMGVTYYSARQYAKAQETYEALLRLQPTNMVALNNLAMVLAEGLGMPEKAIPLAEKAAANTLLSDSDRANVLDTLGQVQVLANQLNAAAATFRRSLDLQNNAETHMHLAEALIRLNRRDDARDEMEEARRLAKKERNDALLQKIDARLKAGMNTPAVKPRR